jgi:hypothetical protein
VETGAPLGDAFARRIVRSVNTGAQIRLSSWTQNPLRCRLRIPHPRQWVKCARTGRPPDALPTQQARKG